MGGALGSAAGAAASAVAQGTDAAAAPARARAAGRPETPSWRRGGRALASPPTTPPNLPPLPVTLPSASPCAPRASRAFQRARSLPGPQTPPGRTAGAASGAAWRPQRFSEPATALASPAGGRAKPASPDLKTSEAAGASAPEADPTGKPAKIQIDVLSALTGELLTAVHLAGDAVVVTLKQEIERATGKPAFGLRLLHGAQPCCPHDFETLAAALGPLMGSGGALVTLSAVVASQTVEEDPQQPVALPFAAQERDYLPGSGLISSALGINEVAWSACRAA